MHQQLAHFGAVRLVGRGVAVELDRSHDPVRLPRDQQQAGAGLHAGEYLFGPECLALHYRTGQHEADAGAVVHACVQQGAELAKIAGDALRRQR
jgi:hypothetical protein